MGLLGRIRSGELALSADPLLHGLRDPGPEYPGGRVDVAGSADAEATGAVGRESACARGPDPSLAAVGAKHSDGLWRQR